MITVTLSIINQNKIKRRFIYIFYNYPIKIRAFMVEYN